MYRTIRTSLLTIALALVLPATAVAGSRESTIVFGQGPGGPVIDGASASIARSAKGVSAHLTMPTPEPGSYAYPPGAQPGHPEAYSLWVFVFFNPAACDGACDGPDLVGNPDVVAGAFNGGGHVVGGQHLNLSGRANLQDATFGGGNAETIGEALAMGYSIADAVIHLAVAPHGELDPELLPEQTKTPIGDATFWWIAVFD